MPEDAAARVRLSDEPKRRWWPADGLVSPRRSEVLSLAALVLAVIVAWIYLVAAPMPGPMGIGGTEGMAAMEMAGTSLAIWSWEEGLLLFVMWAMMMVAMMLPSAAPMIRLFSRIGAVRSTGGGRGTPVLFFAAGYVAVWCAFSTVAALIQWALHSLAVLSPDMRIGSPIAGAVILIAAGIYQWVPLKQSCLSHCRSPLGFLTTSWREGRGGAVRMGVEHGTFCVGCCWMLMALLFVAGVMNLWWVAALSALVLLEKTVVRGATIARVAGALFIVAGVALVA